MFQVSRRKVAPPCARAPSSPRARSGAKCRAQTSAATNSAARMSFTYISSLNVLALEDDDGGEQQAHRVCSAHARVVPEALRREFGLEHVAPAVHVGREKVWAQVLEELHAPDDVERQIGGDRRDDDLHG